MKITSLNFCGLDFSDFKPMDSSGGSIVYISSKHDKVYQKFRSENTASRIAAIAIELLAKNKLEYHLKIGIPVKFKHNLIINIFDYIVPFELFSRQDKLIVWKKITPLNSKDEYISAEFLQNNMYKIWYDISKALLVLKSINIIHNDTTIDNIGIHNGNFILFDFDGSGSPEDKGKDFNTDYDSLYNSFKFRECISPKIQGLVSVIIEFSKLKNISYKQSFEELEKLTIVY